MRVITTDEGLTIHWHNKRWAVVRTFGLLTGNMYQLYERVGDRTWERRPKNGVELFYTIKGAKEYIKVLTNQLNDRETER